MLLTMEWLLKHLEESKLQHQRDDEPHLRIGCNLGWMKLDQYYTLTDDSPAYLAAVVLHPAYRWLSIQYAHTEITPIQLPAVHISKERCILVRLRVNSFFRLSLYSLYSSIIHFRSVALAFGSKTPSEAFKYLTRSRNSIFSSIKKAN